MKHRSTTAIVALLAALVCAACSQQRYAYIADAPRDEAMPITNRTSPTLQTSDKIYIHVYCLDPSSARPFNQETNMNIAEQGYHTNTARQAPGYTINAEGNIIFPSLGSIHAAGKTLDELEREIEARLVEGRLVKDPIVSASMLDFNVAVIGEVAKPQSIGGDGIRMTIFEAIARCGDVTMDGIRSKVTVLRRNDDSYIVDTVDLTSRTILDSPYYYLQSGDIVYVEPTRKKKRSAYRNEDIPTYITTGAAALRIAWTIYYRYTKFDKEYNDRQKQQEQEQQEQEQ